MNEQSAAMIENSMCGLMEVCEDSGSAQLGNFAAVWAAVSTATAGDFGGGVDGGG